MPDLREQQFAGQSFRLPPTADASPQGANDAVDRLRRTGLRLFAKPFARGEADFAQSHLTVGIGPTLAAKCAYVLENGCFVIESPARAIADNADIRRSYLGL
jgi:hypothetical protein